MAATEVIHFPFSAQSHRSQQILELNESFGHLIASLTKLESVRFLPRDLVRRVGIARVYANREFFDNFQECVEDDAKWAYRSQRDFDEKLNLEVRDSEQRHERMELPPRVVILADWDMSDEDRYDEDRAARQKKSVGRRRRNKQHSPKKSRSRTRHPTLLATPKKGASRR